MNRRSFLHLLGIAPALPIAAKIGAHNPEECDHWRPCAIKLTDGTGCFRDGGGSFREADFQEVWRENGVRYGYAPSRGFRYKR